MSPISIPEQQTIELGEEGNLVLPESIRYYLSLRPGEKNDSHVRARWQYTFD